MPVSQESINKSVYDLLRSRGFDPVPLDSTGRQDIDIEDADIFRFDFKQDDDNLGTGWVTVEGKELVFYIDDSLSGQDSFLNFLQFVKRWSQRKLLGFKITNKDRLSSDMKKRTSMKKKEQLGEGYYPMGKKASYNDSVPTVKILLQHTRQIEEGEQRFRNVAKIFVENVDGERFLLPTVRPGIARVYARHVAEGGTPYDDKGKHITSLVEEYTKMAGFVRATKNGQFNESAQRLVTEGISHYAKLRETLTRMTSRRGYNNYFENYSPVLNEESTEETNLNELFVQETLDPRIESVMPILNRLSKNITEMSAVKELEEWAESITEVEDETTKTLAEPAEEMLDELSGDLLQKVADKAKDKAKTMAIRQTQIMNPHGYGTAHHDGDMELKDKLGQAQSHYNRLASKAGEHKKKMTDLEMKKRWATDLPAKLKNKVDEAPGAETLKHNQNTEKSNLKAFDLEEKSSRMGKNKTTKTVVPKTGASALDKAKQDAKDTEENNPFFSKWKSGDIEQYGKMAKPIAGITEGFSDSREVADQIIDSIGGEEDLSLDEIYRAIEEYQSMMDNPHKLDVDEVAQIVLDKLHGVGELDEELDANQKRVGQLGPTEPVGKNEKNLRGKLVGASESVELDTLKTLSGIK